MPRDFFEIRMEATIHTPTTVTIAPPRIQSRIFDRDDIDMKDLGSLPVRHRRE
jgi:hypothetical protein